MIATFKTVHQGNSVLQAEIWILPIKAAKAVVDQLCPSKGSYWENNLARPTRQAIRAKAETVRVYTSGFSTGELSNLLACVNCDVDRSQEL